MIVIQQPTNAIRPAGRGTLLHLSDRLISAEGKSEWRAHWRVVFASIVGIMIAQTHIYSLGVMMGPLEQELGWGGDKINPGLPIMSMGEFPLAPEMGVGTDGLGLGGTALTGIRWEGKRLEFQYQMRILYAVFGLKKKKKK